MFVENIKKLEKVKYDKKMDESLIANVLNKARQWMVNKDGKFEMLKYLKKMKKMKNPRIQWMEI